MLAALPRPPSQTKTTCYRFCDRVNIFSISVSTRRLLHWVMGRARSRFARSWPKNMFIYDNGRISWKELPETDVLGDEKLRFSLLFC